MNYLKANLDPIIGTVLGTSSGIAYATHFEKLWLPIIVGIFIAVIGTACSFFIKRYLNKKFPPKN